MIATMVVQCFTDLKLIIMELRYHLCAISVLVVARNAVVPISMFSADEIWTFWQTELNTQHMDTF